MNRLNFEKTIATGGNEIIPYTFAYGERSSLWSFAQLLRYADSFAIENNTMFILRNSLCTPTKRVYAMPLCSEDKFGEAVETIVSDALSHNAIPQINNVTAKFASVLQADFSDIFDVEEDRDYSEYVYLTTDLANYRGGKFQAKRNLVKNFLQAYGANCTITTFGQSNIDLNSGAASVTSNSGSDFNASGTALNADSALDSDVNLNSASSSIFNADANKFLHRNIDLSLHSDYDADSDKPIIKDILEFQTKWLAMMKDLPTYNELAEEDGRIRLMLDNYQALGITGFAVKVNGATVGYAFGNSCSSDCFDLIVEKADTSFKGIYQFINNQVAKTVAKQLTYINMEEDIGLEGLRKSKLSYNPCFMIEKFNASYKN